MPELELEKRRIAQPNAPDLSALVNQPTMLSQMFAQAIDAGVNYQKSAMKLDMSNRLGVARKTMQDIYNQYNAKPMVNLKDMEDFNSALSGVRTASIMDAPKWMRRDLESAMNLDEMDYQSKFGAKVDKSAYQMQKSTSALGAYEIAENAGLAAYEGNNEKIRKYAKELIDVSSSYVALGGSPKEAMAMNEAFEASVTYNFGLKFVEQGATQADREKRFREFVKSRHLIEKEKFSQRGVDKGFSKLSTYMKRIREKASDSLDISQLMDNADGNKALTGLATPKQADLFVDSKAKHLAVETAVNAARKQGQGSDYKTYQDLVADLTQEHPDWTPTQVRTEAQIQFDTLYPDVPQTFEQKTLAQAQIIKPSPKYFTELSGYLTSGNTQQFMQGVDAVKKLQALESEALTSSGGLSDDLIALAIQGRDILTQSGMTEEELSKQIQLAQKSYKAPPTDELKLRVKAFMGKNDIGSANGAKNAEKAFKKYVGSSPSLINKDRDLQEFVNIARQMLNTSGITSEDQAYAEAGRRIKMRFGDDFMSIKDMNASFSFFGSNKSGYQYPLTRYNMDGNEKAAINDAAKQLALLGVMINEHLIDSPEDPIIKNLELTGSSEGILDAKPTDLLNKRYYTVQGGVTPPGLIGVDGVRFDYGGKNGRLALSSSEVKVPMYDQNGNIIGHRLTWEAWHQAVNGELTQLINPQTGEPFLIVQHFLDEIAPKQSKQIKRAKLQSEAFAARASDMYADAAIAGYGDESLSYDFSEFEVDDIQDGTFGDKFIGDSNRLKLKNSTEFEDNYQSVEDYLNEFKIMSYNEIRQAGVQQVKRISQEVIDNSKDIITRYAKQFDVPVNVALKIAEKESSFDNMAKAATSTAKGLFQFIDSTWRSMVNKHGKKLNVGINDIFDTAGNTKMGVMLIKENMDMFQRAFGREPNGKELYAMHFAGPTVGMNLIRAAIQSPQTPVEDIFPPKWILANKSILFGTAREAFERLTRGL